MAHVLIWTAGIGSQPVKVQFAGEAIQDQTTNICTWPDMRKHVIEIRQCRQK